MTRFARQFRKVGRSLSRVELMRSSMDETFAIEPDDLLDKDAGRRFLDFYGDAGLDLAFERYGFYDALRAKGYDRFEIETWAHDERHTLLLDGWAGDQKHRLMELMVRRDRLVIDPPEGAPAVRTGLDVMTVDWLTLRDPRGAFTERRMRLPGQDAPGLGVGERVMELLYRVVDRLDLDALLTVAEYFHNAMLYARELPYVDPTYQGQLAALESLLMVREGLDLAQATWAMEWGYVVDVDDSVVRWRGEAMVKPAHPELEAYLASDAHAAMTEKARARLKYRLRRDAFFERWEAERDGLLEAPGEADAGVVERAP